MIGKRHGFGLLTIACLLGGCAAPVEPEARVVIDPPNFEAELAKKIPADWQWISEGYCIDLDTHEFGAEVQVFARGFGNYPYEPTPRTVAETLTTLGLLERLTPREKEDAAGGVWYRRTDAGKAVGLRSNFCFGTRKFLRVKSIEAPRKSALFGWQREVRYEYQVSGMPPFSQTDSFKVLFPTVPRDGEVRSDVRTLGLYWEPEWTYGPPGLLD